MATIDDVEQGVCSALAGLLFPDEAYLSGSVATCLTPWSGAPGSPIYLILTKLYVGEPVTAGLEADIQAGISNIGIMRVAGATRNVTEFAPGWLKTSVNVPTLAAALSDDTVVFGGVAGAGQAVSVTAGSTCYAYRTTANDNAATVAAVFATVIPAAVAVGAMLSAPLITAVSVVADQSAFWRTGEKETLLQIAIVAVPFVGADGPLVRAALTRAVYGIESLSRADGSLTRFIGLPDGTTAQILGADERDDDTVRRDDMWRRWITLRVRYDVGVSQVQNSVVAALVVGNMNGGRLIWIGDGAASAKVLTDGKGNLLADASGVPLGMLG